MPHDHSHADENLSDGRLVLAIGLNLLLTVVEFVAGLIAGSLSLMADALHNFNDCGSLVIALVARRISRRPQDDRRTFGYRRAEIIGALINLTILVVIGLFLTYEAVERLIEPRPIDGWIVIVVAAIALVVDIGTAALLYAMSRGNLNMRAAYLHNLGDAATSVGVIFAGIMVLLFDITWTDAAVTLVIAAWILWQSLAMMGRSIHILMEGAPADVDPDALIAAMEAVEGVAGIHHLHVWELDEEHRALEAHVVVAETFAGSWSAIKQTLKQLLHDDFRIQHTTLEFEAHDEDGCAPCAPQAHSC